MGRPRVVALCAVALVAALGIAALATLALRPRDDGGALCQPGRLELGMADAPGGAETVAELGLGYRYQYLAGGLDNTWRDWSPSGEFAAEYVRESHDAGVCPVLTYYMLLQSNPGEGAEGERVLAALRDPELMARYLADLRALFEQLGREGEPAIVHVEPDLWGFLQQDAADASTPVALPGFEGLPSTAAGLAQAIVGLRNTHAPNVQLAYHASHWGNGRDLVYDDDPRLPAAAAADGAAFYAALGADFDLVFTEFTDRDAGYKEALHGDGGASWWDAATFERHLAYLAALRRAVGRPLVLWQVPYGNTVMRAADNTWNHYQDNKVEVLLGEPGYATLARYRDAGVVAVLFGRGADGATDASDASGDGVTNPEPIAGNTRPSLTADDDGGLFRELAAAYARAGALPLRGE
ncbi:MAG: hypothetical protein IT303_17280 [Dehalococcoidia bacterium]|nr:hypothetical protein [Dehalococcoidia bacterium]